MLRQLAAMLGVGFALAGCGSGPQEVNGETGRAFSIPVGGELGITLQNIGPGEYASPPRISSAALRFLDVSQVTPIVPAGVTQRFRFVGARPGRAVVLFRHTGEGRTVEDTIDITAPR